MKNLIKVLYAVVLAILVWSIWAFAPVTALIKVFATIGAFVIVSWIFLAITGSANKNLNGPFFAELNELTDEYVRDRDSEKYYNAILSMRKKPKTEEAKNAYYLNISKALYGMKKYEEALVAIEKVKPTTDSMKENVRRQTKLINESIEVQLEECVKEA